MDQVLAHLLDHSLLLLRERGHSHDDFDHAEAVAVGAELVEVVKYLFENEVLHVDCEAFTLENLPDHVRSLIIFRKLKDFAFQRPFDEFFLLRHRHVVKYGLNCMRALLVTAYSDEVYLDHVEDLESLVGRAVREQLLEEIVAVLINHDFRELTVDFAEHELDQAWTSFGELLLQVAGAGL